MRWQPLVFGLVAVSVVTAAAFLVPIEEWREGRPSTVLTVWNADGDALVRTDLGGEEFVRRRSRVVAGSADDPAGMALTWEQRRAELLFQAYYSNPPGEPASLAPIRGGEGLEMSARIGGFPVQEWNGAPAVGYSCQEESGDTVQGVLVGTDRGAVLFRVSFDPVETGGAPPEYWLRALAGIELLADPAEGDGWVVSSGLGSDDEDRCRPLDLDGLRADVAGAIGS